MDGLVFRYKETCAVDDAAIEKLGAKLQPEIKRVAAAWANGYDSEYASLGLPHDHAMISRVEEAVAQKLALKPVALVVVGIGGSNLGARAVYEALNEVGDTSDMPVYWADTVDSDYIARIYAHVETELKAGHSIILAIISKSGTTTESVANAELFLSLLATYKKNDVHRFVVVISDEGSALWKLAQSKEFTCLAIPQLVGGRYSVFSAAGLFPLAMLGVDIKALSQGANKARELCTSSDISINMAAIRASILCDQYRQGIRVHDLFVFGIELRATGNWYRQLMGESIGKVYDRTGKKVSVGFVPTVSVGSIDLHSVGQLYLSGPRITSTRFIAAKKCHKKVVVPAMVEFDSLVPHLQGKSFAAIMNAIIEGTQRAYKKDGRPFVTLEVPELSAYYCGQMMQVAMVEMMYLGFLFNINPFDQPQVELYKKETREILANE